ncbi:MAG: hypothetical protein PHX68_03100 [Alphaproteobacteria bacterium]|nr:hypothetical protein [Alphaproteobacteria bacterium]
MTDAETKNRIQSILGRMQKIFSDRSSISRQDFIKKNGLTTGIDYSFSLTGAEIVGNRDISDLVCGCTGLTKVFCHLAKDSGLDLSVVLTANYQDWEKAKLRQTGNSKPEGINGHQIMAVRLSDGKLHAFDLRSPLKLIDGDVKAGNFINPSHFIAAILEPAEYEKVNTYQDIQNLYASGNRNNPRFSIRPARRLPAAALLKAKAQRG